jgi:hypothetical protein
MINQITLQTLDEIKKELKKIPRCKYGTKYYTPIIPRADTCELAQLGERLMLIHGSPANPDMTLYFAPKDEVWGGWVVGISDLKI